MSGSPKLELFHVLVHPGCSRVRQWIVDHQLEEAVQFRNLHFPEHAAALQGHGAGEADVPCVWDGAALHKGAEACIARLKAELDLGRAT